MSVASICRATLRPAYRAHANAIQSTLARKMDISTTSAAPQPNEAAAAQDPNELLRRVKKLEKELEKANEQLKQSKAARAAQAHFLGSVSQPDQRAYDPARYSTRYIALKFAYLGQQYNGLEHHKNNKTRLQSIEEVLWRAMVKGRLIWPADGNLIDVDWDGHDFSKCGRTDRGVSAFGQVVALRVRSNRPLAGNAATPMDLDEVPVVQQEGEGGSTLVNGESKAGGGRTDPGEDILLDMPIDPASEGAPGTADTSMVPTREFDDIRDEIPYIHVLNQLLPPDIRILAWLPHPPEGFSARFSCQERRYRYFFTQPVFNPTPGNIGLDIGLSKDANGEPRRDGWLDIEAMRTAAKKYEGLHDFRNLCKIDASKQITNFMRRIFVSDIRAVDPASDPAAYVVGKGFSETESSALTGADFAASAAARGPKVYQFVLHGSAFLWHQVRHMVAILFLVGQGLESPDVVDQLLDVEKNPCKPQYEMADDQPLVLWDCIFPEGSVDREDALDWIWAGQSAAGSKNGIERDRYGHGGIVDETWKVWRRCKMDEILAGNLLNLAVTAGGHKGPDPDVKPSKKNHGCQWVFRGGDSASPKGKYIPIMQIRRSDTVEVINARYRVRKGIIDPEPADADE